MLPSSTMKDDGERSTNPHLWDKLSYISILSY